MTVTYNKHRSLGYVQVTSLSAAAGLGTIPDGATFALIGVESQGVRWRDDGTAPTTTVGMVLNPGDVLEYDGAMSAIQFVEVAASAKLNVTFYA